MVVIKASVMGFCAGVRSAVHHVDRAIELGREEGLPVYTIGALIHNDKFLAGLGERGVSVIESPEGVEPGIAVIRAHGIDRKLLNRFWDAGFTIMDGTCPRVLRSQTMVKRYTENSWQVLLAGDPEHGEVTVVAGAAELPGKVQIIHTVEDAQQVTCAGPTLLLSQTTFSSSLFDQICHVLERRSVQDGFSLKIERTICPATRDRQLAVSEICKEVEAMIIVGGQNSSNTRRLLELSTACGVPSWHINGVEELPDEIFSYTKVGLTAGASTPDWLVEDIERHLLSSG